MKQSINDLKKIANEFAHEYMEKTPYDKYVNGCGISKLGIEQDVKNHKFDLREGESLDDLCLSVMFREDPPKNLDFPSEYKGVRVFYEVVGEIRFA